MTQFALNTLAYGDPAGWGEWLVGHYRQHLAYNQVLAARTPAIIIQTWPILTVEGGDSGLRFWLDSHEQWHEAVRPLANVTSIDLSVVDFRKPDEFYQWVDLHNQEHTALDQAFGVA